MKNKKYIIGVLAVVAVVLIGTIVLLISGFGKKDKIEVITKTKLEKIVNKSELSTFESVYNGISEVLNENNEEKIDFYVAYEARVKAGINVEEIIIDIDRDEKIISIDIPEIKITEVNVDITSLDYIFMNNKANTETVSEKAYKACIADVKTESEKQTAIIELAEDNAKNILKALIEPFVQQTDGAYTVRFE